MIPAMTIRNLAKPYTKRSIAGEGAKVGKTAWSNNAILLWETPPAFVANHYAAQTSPQLDTIEMPNNMPRLYITEIRYHYHDDHEMQLVRMSDGNGRNYWLDARYISAAIKHAKRNARNLEFAFCAATSQGRTITGILATILDQPVALLATMDEDNIPVEHAPDWQLINNHIPVPISYDQPAYVEGTQARLLERQQPYRIRKEVIRDGVHNQGDPAVWQNN